MNILYLLIIALSVIIFWQDLKNRTIHVLLAILLLIVCVTINLKSDVLLFENIGLNTLFLMVNLLGIFIYYSIKNGKIVNPVNQFIGIGDFIFMLAIAPLFNLKEFILFIICGFIFSLLVHFISNYFKEVKTIPLAGYLALFIILNISISLVFNVSTLLL